MTRSGAVPLYASGVDHYRSPARRDPVKLVIEEPISHRVYDYAVRSLGKAPRDRLRVVDLGCGTGDGLSLITETHLTAPPVVNEHELSYLGVDLDPDMVAAARDINADARHVEFEVGDMRNCMPDEPVDLIMSCGVPYSHLTTSEIAEVITTTFAHIRDHRTRSVVVVDVLGRYSIEWPTWWGSERWPYAMTFFENDAPPIRDDMTHYAAADLGTLISTAASTANVHISDVTFTDRSIGVGRHTSTREFNTTIPPYRDLVNRLLNGDNTVRVDDLRLPDLSTEPAPPAIGAFFASYTRRWNDRVDAAHAISTTEQARYLGIGLAALETEQRPGLGVGHSLMATITIDAY